MKRRVCFASVVLALLLAGGLLISVEDPRSRGRRTGAPAPPRQDRSDETADDRKGGADSATGGPASGSDTGGSWTFETAIVGRVVNGARGVDGATVRFVPRGSGWREFSFDGRCDADGRFRVPVPSDLTGSVLARAGVGVGTVSGVSAGMEVVVHVKTPAAFVRVRVLSRDGEAATGASVAVGRKWSGRTDAKGDVSVPLFTEGVLDCKVKAAGCRDRSVCVWVGQEDTHVIQLEDSPGHRLTCVDADDRTAVARPSAYESLDAEQNMAIGDRNGVLSLDRTPSSGRAWIRAAGYVPTRVILRPGDATVELARAAELTVLIRAPGDEVLLRAQVPTATGSISVVRVVSTNEAVRLDGLPQGRVVRLRCDGPGLIPIEAELYPPFKAEDMPIVLDHDDMRNERCQVTLELRDKGGTPLIDVPVIAIPPSSWNDTYDHLFRVSGRTDRNGKFAYLSPWNRAWVVTASFPRCHPFVRQRIGPVGPENSKMTITAQLFVGTIAGVVLSKQGHPISGVGVYAVAVGNKTEMAAYSKSGSDGRFKLRIPWHDQGELFEVAGSHVRFGTTITEEALPGSFVQLVMEE